MGWDENKATNAALVWAIATGLVIALLIQMAWWHPACSIRGDSAVDFGYGFPFPYWTYVIGRTTSAGFRVMPHIFILDVVILAAIAYALCRLLLRPLIRWKAAIGTVLLFAGVMLCLSAIAPVVMLRSEFHLARSIANVGEGGRYTESYFSYRPVFLRPDGTELCRVT